MNKNNFKNLCGFKLLLNWGIYIYVFIIFFYENFCFVLIISKRINNMRFF